MGCDVNVIKLGIEYAYSFRLTLRAGYNHSDNPVQSSDAGFNILAPGVIEDHIALGITHALGKNGELTASYMHAFENSVTGDAFFNNLGFGPVGGQETIRMFQNSLGVAYGHRF